MVEIVIDTGLALGHDLLGVIAIAIFIAASVLALYVGHRVIRSYFVDR